MNSIQKAAQSLGEAAVYSEADNSLTLQGQTVRAYSQRGHLYAEVQMDGQRFVQPMVSGKVLTQFLKDVHRGKITLARMDERHLRVNGWDSTRQYRRRRKMAAPLRAVSVLLGIPAALCGLLLSIVTLTEYPMPSDYLSVLPVGLLGVFWGVGLIHHGFAKQPLSLAKVMETGMGSAMTAFGAAMMCYTHFADLGRADRFGMGTLFAFCLLGGVMLTLHGMRILDGNEFSPVTILRRAPDLPPTEQLQGLLAALRQRTMQDSLVLTLEPERQAGLFGSKLGGLPYWDAAKPLPTNDAGEPLPLLAQFDLAELPETALPRTGLLQFFLGSYQYADEAPAKVVWHEHIDRSVTEEQVRAMGFPAGADDLPFTGECACSLTKQQVCLELDDSTTRGILDAVAEAEGLELEPTLTLSELLEDDYGVGSTSAGSHLLGYPYFEEDDPRTGSDEGYGQLLFQLESAAGAFPVMIGDYGRLAFFIRPDDLAAHRFDDTMFSWE